MLLTVSKRLEFSASRRLFSRARSKEENLRLFGGESSAQYGTGRNYAAYFVFTGSVDPTTGMLINISEIKQRAGSIISERYDHRFLNEDNDAFRDVPPTSENIARQLFREVAPLFAKERPRLVAVHLRETPDRSVTAYANAIESNYWFAFSAARRTISPHLSEAENKALFGASVREHGHNYRARLTFSGQPPAQADLDNQIRYLISLFDHKNLNRDVAALHGQPITTESLSRFLLQATSERLPVARIRLHERSDFFAETWNNGAMYLALQHSFSAAHRLHVASFSIEQNTELFGKCNNPRGHGHTYVAEATVGGEYNERSGTVFSFGDLQAAMHEALQTWSDRHLDLETAEFRQQPSTGENIVRALWQKLDKPLQHRLARLRLWETDNNRFTLRRT